MNLKFLQKHKSIDTFNEIELPHLTVLTGLNGSGKTHLLESIKNGKSQIDDIPANEIVQFDFRTFMIDDEATFNSEQIHKEKQNAWKTFTNQSNPNSSSTPKYKNSFTQYKNQLGIENCIKILEFSKNKSFLSLKKKDFGSEHEELYLKYRDYKKKINAFLSQHRNANTTKGLRAVIRKYPNPIDEIQEEEFYSLYEPIFLKNEFLPTQIGKLFLDYWDKSDKFKYNKYKKGEDYNASVFQQEFEEIHGPKPWVLIDDILGNFNSLKFTINNPESLEFDVYKTTNFNLRITDTEQNVVMPFSSLSSGEKILFALVLSIYKSIGDRIFPSVLLLDEIDASLHPSQIKNLLEVLNNTFITENNVKVIMATHSPTTIALAEDDNIYIVNKNSKNRIEKQTKSEALNILSEGFITLNEGLQIADHLIQSKLNLFTEGNNIKFIKKALEFYCPELIANISIVENLEDRSGNNQLNVLYDFFLRLEHKNQVLFIFDCDITKERLENESTFYLNLPYNDKNTKFKNGIENIFPEHLILDEHYNEKTKKHDNGKIVTIKEPSKPIICNYIINNGTKDDFAGFKSMILKIKAILNCNEAQHGV